MLRNLCLLMFVAASASMVLKFEDHAGHKDMVQDMLPWRNSREQRLSKVKSFNQGEGGLEKNYSLGQDPKVHSISCPVIGNIANCSRLGITDVRQIDDVPSNIIGLDLAFNSIRGLLNKPLSRFTQLEWLNLGHNNLQQLNSDSFYNLNVLKILRINSNNLTLREGTFPDDVFTPLVSLQQLWMNNNSLTNQGNLDYPDKALAQLHKVRDLYIDGLPNKIFGLGFSNMSSLLKLTLTGQNEGYCYLPSLGKNMFTNLAGLKNLSLINCKINGSDRDVFVPLKELLYLDLSGNDELKLEHLGEALGRIRMQTKLKVLNIRNIINPFSQGVVVTSNFSKSLPRGLEELIASSNAFEVLEIGVLDNLPKSLTVLDVGSNKFAFLEYLKDLNQLENLLTLTLSQWAAHILPYYYPPNQKVPASFKNTYGGHPYIHQPLPPKLQVLNIINAGWSNDLTEFHFNESNNLSILNMDFNNFPVLQGPITGLTSLRNLSLYSCRIKEIHPVFFQNFTSLQSLNLSANYFGSVSFTTNESIFSNLANLTVLDLSFTDIRYISTDAFKGLNNLEVLLLQMNPIPQFYFNISHMTNLNYLNLSMTSLVTLNPEITQMLDNIRNNSLNFTVELSKNTFDCFCSKLEFLKWMVTTKVVAKPMKITCSFGDGSKRDLDFLALVKTYDTLKRECASNFELFSIVISATLLLLFAIAGFMAYTFRVKLQYLYYSSILYYRNSKKKNSEQEFEYDVFVSYAHEDHDFVVNTLYPQLESNGLKIHIHGLHFTAGEFISSNIVNAVHSSKHTLVVLTQNHLNSKWSKYEVEMANMEQVHTGRRVLVFLIKESIPKLTTQLLFHIKNNTYIKYPATEINPTEINVFWSKLVSDLKTRK